MSDWDEEEKREGNGNGGFGFGFSDHNDSSSDDGEPSLSMLTAIKDPGEPLQSQGGRTQDEDQVRYPINF